jgi:hypothetical protein
MLAVLCCSSAVLFAQESKSKVSAEPVSPAKEELKLMEVDRLESEESTKVGQVRKGDQINEVGDKRRSRSYYAKQNANWESTLSFQKSDANAWANYYKSNRYGYYSSESKELSTSEQGTLDDIVEEMEKNVPETYEYHYISYLNGNYDPSEVNHLQRAYELRPSSVELYDDFVAHYEIVNNKLKKTEFCQKLNSSNDIHKDVMNYNYNVLMSLDPNAILITNGKNDTYPIWMWQEVKNVRKDVTVLNLDLLQVDEYRTRKLKELNLSSGQAIENNQTAFLKDLASRNQGKLIYLALTVSPKVVRTLQTNLYVTGLAFKYSAGAMDNIPVLQKNWEKNFKAEYLNSGASSSNVRRLNSNYIMPLLILNNFYSATGEKAKAEKTLNLATKLAKEGGKEEQVQLFLKK